MKTSLGIAGIIVVIITLVSAFSMWQQRDKDHSPSSPSPSILPVSPTPLSIPSVDNVNIRVFSPKPDTSVRIPFTITGEARVFENQLNYRIRSTNGSILMEGMGYANSPDTGQYGLFQITVSSLPYMTSTKISIEVFDYSAKDGSEIDTVHIPVVLEQPTTTVQAFFGKKNTTTGDECSTVYPVRRIVPKTPAIARIALDELLKGPYLVENNNGFFTHINPHVSIQKLSIVNGTARVDFDKTLEEGVGGSCKVTAIRAQIVKTLQQFPTIQTVVISIDGRSEDILQP